MLKKHATRRRLSALSLAFWLHQQCGRHARRRHRRRPHQQPAVSLHRALGSTRLTLCRPNLLLTCRCSSRSTGSLPGRRRCAVRLLPVRLLLLLLLLLGLRLLLLCRLERFLVRFHPLGEQLPAQFNSTRRGGST